MINKKVNYKEEYGNLIKIITDNAGNMGLATLQKVSDANNAILDKEAEERKQAEQQESWKEFL